MAPISRPDSASNRQDAPAWQTRTGARRVALFASGLQRSDAPTDAMAAEAITATIRRLSLRGCVDRMAQEFGDHPDAAAARMRWICQLTAHMPAWPQRPAGAGRPGNRASSEIHPSSDHYRAPATDAA
jgi:hypothetical protein